MHNTTAKLILSDVLLLLFCKKGSKQACVRNFIFLRYILHCMLLSKICFIDIHPSSLIPLGEGNLRSTIIGFNSYNVHVRGSVKNT